MTAISDNYVLLTKEIGAKEEIGVKKIINKVARRIKVLAKQEQTEEGQMEMRKETLKKLVLQVLLDGPDLRFLPCMVILAVALNFGFYKRGKSCFAEEYCDLALHLKF